MSGLLVIPNTGIVNILGQKDGRVGPLKAFFRTSLKALIAGATVTATGDILTFTGLDPSTRFKVGDILAIDTTPIKTLVYVREVDDETIKMGTPDVDSNGKHKQLNLTVGSATAIRPWTMRDLGDVSDEGIKITWTEKTAPVKFAGRGDIEANHFSSGSEMKISVPLAEMGLEEASSLMDGSAIPDFDVDGDMAALSFTKRLGYNFKANADSLDLFAYGQNGNISTDPRDRARIWLCNFQSAFEQQRNATSQTVVNLEGNVYEDNKHMKDGKPVFMSINPELVVFD